LRERERGEGGRATWVVKRLVKGEKLGRSELDNAQLLLVAKGLKIQ